MKTTTLSNTFLLVFIIVCVIACNKQLSSSKSTETSTTANTTSSASTAAAITVEASAGSTDSIDIMQQCSPGFFRDSLDSAGLPSAILTYLSSNYSGYSFLKGFTIKDSAGVTSGYVVIILFDNKPVGLQFDAAGDFVKVLEQRQPGDLQGPGWHNGGLFGNRNGLQQDTIAISALPSAITKYMSTNYPGDTLLKAFVNIDSSYLIISADSGIYATLFSSSGSFIKRIKLPAPGSILQPVAQSVLPTSITTYLSATYPGYVYNRAFELTANGTVEGYIVIIDANNTRYAVAFDASGTFISATTIF